MHCRLCKSQSQWTPPTNRFSKWILQTIRFCTDKAPAYPTAYAANAASMQPQGRYVNCKLGTYWGFRGQPKSARIVQIVQISTQVVSTLKFNLFLLRLKFQHNGIYTFTKTVLRGKIVLVIKKNFWNSRVKALVQFIQTVKG